MVRLNLYNRALFCGAQAIQWELDDLMVRPLPSLSTINRILARNELTHRRTGRYEPKGRKYPTLVGEKPGDVHQTDFVGPCYLSGPVRFYSLHSVDLATHRCAVEPVLTRSGPETVNALWASWMRLGMPKHQQVDNEMVFYGSPAHPRGMGNLIRLCLLHGIEAWFIPPAEPWRNGVVEKFNDHWRQKFLDRIVMDCEAALRRESLAYEGRHNGPVPLQCAGWENATGGPRGIGGAPAVSSHADAPDTSAVETRRRDAITSSASFAASAYWTCSGERFPPPRRRRTSTCAPPWTSPDSALEVYLDDVLIDEHPYRLR